MTLNLNKYGAEMQTAWKKVCDANSGTDWALFGYEGTSFTLKLLSTGSDGLDELKDDLNANKIMYAFIRVNDPKTSLPKFVFLHWQGESAAGTRKGLCATHLTDIEKYFHGAHITINARNEDEVDEAEIIDKVSKATASAYNFKDKPTAMEQAPAPVGSAHQKIVPLKELPSLTEREKFWIQEESKEKERIAAEKHRKVSERKTIEEERKRREEEESKAREAVVKERERKISKIREAETVTSSGKESSDWDKQIEQDLKDEEERQKRSEDLRRARNEEARHLISQRSENPRALFERNTSVGQLNYRRAAPNPKSPNAPNPESPKPDFPARVQPAAVVDSVREVEKPKGDIARSPKIESTSPHKSDIVKPPRNDIVKATFGNNANANMVSTDDIVVPPPDSFGNEESVKSQPEPDVTSGAHQPDLIQDVAASRCVPDLTSEAGRHTPNQNNGIQPSETELGICAVALYDYEAADDTEISFDPGQVITHIEQIDQGWWYGFSGGHYGLFPANYVEIIDASEIDQH